MLNVDPNHHPTDPTAILCDRASLSPAMVGRPGPSAGPHFIDANTPRSASPSFGSLPRTKETPTAACLHR